MGKGYHVAGAGVKWYAGNGEKNAGGRVGLSLVTHLHFDPLVAFQCRVCGRVYIPGVFYPMTIEWKVEERLGHISRLSGVNRPLCASCDVGSLGGPPHGEGTMLSASTEESIWWQN